MLKPCKKVRRSGVSSFVAAFVMVSALVMVGAGVAAAAPARNHSHRAWLAVHRVLATGLHARPGVRPRRGLRARVAIVGGNRISIAQAPWQVTVLRAIPVEIDGTVRFEVVPCGGSILDAKHVITAAHCLFDPITGTPLPAGDVAVVAGVSDLALEGEAGEQFRVAASLRVHPYFNYAAGEGTSDDVAVVALSEELVLSSAPGSAVNSIGLVATGPTPPEGTQVNLTGFGLESLNEEFPNGTLNSLGGTVGFPRKCGGEADAVFVCASASTGSACGYDEGSGLTTTASAPALLGVMDTFGELSGEVCRAGSTNGFVNLAAPEIRGFIEGESSPPEAPRGREAIEVRGVPQVGYTLTCQPGSWSGGPAITYLFIDGSSGQVLQSGASSTYPLSVSDVGREIYCEVQATNAGGTGSIRTGSLRAIEPAPTEPRPIQVVPPGPPPTPIPAPGGGAPPAPSGGVEAAMVHDEGVLLTGTSLAVQHGGTALAKLDCKEAEGCSGTLTLSVKRAGKLRGHGKAPRAVTIGIGTFSLEAGRTGTVKIHLNAAGRALLGSDRGHVAASLTIAEVEGGTRSDGVQLVAQQQKAKGAHGKKR